MLRSMDPGRGWVRSLELAPALYYMLLISIVSACSDFPPQPSFQTLQLDRILIFFDERGCERRNALER